LKKELELSSLACKLILSYLRNKKEEKKKKLTENISRRLFCGKEARRRCYASTAALRLIVQPCDEDGYLFSPILPCNGAPVE
jgi:hypothetical protein